MVDLKEEEDGEEHEDDVDSEGLVWKMKPSMISQNPSNSPLSSLSKALMMVVNK